MEFEYDPKKSVANREKHGIDFEEAQGLWKDPKAVEIKAAHKGEPRYALLGTINGKNWTAIITYRNERPRIISVRRSRKKEVEIYEDDSI